MEDREVVPAPMTYSLHVLDPAPDVRAVRVTRETVRRGRKIGFSRSVVTDADDPGRIIALTSGTGVSLGAAPSGFRPVDLPSDLPEVDLPPLHVVFGARRDPDGWRLPELATRLASTSASLHLGPIHVVMRGRRQRGRRRRFRSRSARRGSGRVGTRAGNRRSGAGRGLGSAFCRPWSERALLRTC